MREYKHAAVCKRLSLSLICCCCCCKKEILICLFFSPPLQSSVGGGYCVSLTLICSPAATMEHISTRERRDMLIFVGPSSPSSSLCDLKKTGHAIPGFHLDYRSSRPLTSQHLTLRHTLAQKKNTNAQEQIKAGREESGWSVGGKCKLPETGINTSASWAHWNTP